MIMKFNINMKFISYGGEPQNVCNFELGLNKFAKPKSVKKNNIIFIKAPLTCSQCFFDPEKKS
jgi:hypothetical protein